MRTAARIRHGLDRAEKIFARGARAEAPEALEIFVAFLGVARAGVEIRAAVIALPDFHERIANRRAAGVEDASAEIRDFADRGRERVVHDEQIVVGIEREVIRVKWPFGLRRCVEEFLGECAGDGEEREAKSAPGEEAAAVE